MMFKDTNDDTARIAAPPPVIEYIVWLPQHLCTNLIINYTIQTKLYHEFYDFSLELGINRIYLASGIS